MVTIISKTNCPGCRMTKLFLKKRNIDFVEHNINNEPDYIDKMHQLGISSAPVVMYEGEYFTGFQPDALKKLAAKVVND